MPTLEYDEKRADYVYILIEFYLFWHKFIKKFIWNLLNTMFDMNKWVTSMFLTQFGMLVKIYETISKI